GIGALTLDPSPIRWARVWCGVLDEFVGGEELEFGEFAGGEEIVGEEGSGFVGGEAAGFLEPLFFVDTLGADGGEELSTGVVAAGFLVDAFDEALVDGLLDGKRVKAPAHGVAVMGDVADELVE